MLSSDTVLAFDFGIKHMGVALGSLTLRDARPLTAMQRKNKTEDWATLQALIDKWQPVALVVGQPLTLEGEQQEMSRLAAKFANQLRGRFGLPVHEVDERLTSRLAHAIIRDAENPSFKRQTHKAKVDQVSAQLILQTWFDTHEPTS